MNAPRRLVALVAAGSLALVACGSDDPVAAPADEPAPAVSPDDTSGGSTAPPATMPGFGPDATIDPEVPAEYLPAIGPVEVIGDALPMLTTDIADDPAVGMAAPALVGLGYDGSTVRINAKAAGPTMVVFLAHWCPHCNAEIPRINQLRDDGLLPADLNVVAVSTASNPGQPNFPPAQWLDSMDWTYDAMADGIDTDREVFIAADAFGVSGFPFTALVDGNGVVQARWSGERDAGEVVALIADRLGLA